MMYYSEYGFEFSFSFIPFKVMKEIVKSLNMIGSLANEIKKRRTLQFVGTPVKSQEVTVFIEKSKSILIGHLKHFTLARLQLLASKRKNPRDRELIKSAGKETARAGR